MQNISGYLLSCIKYGDQDAVVHSFTLEQGYQSFFIRGIYSVKNKKKAYLSPLNELIFNVRPPRDSLLRFATKIELHRHLNNGDIRTAAVQMLIADFLNQNLRREERNDAIYSEIGEMLQHLDKKNYTAHYIFLVRCLQHFGFSPILGTGKDFLDPESGTFADSVRNEKFNREISAIWYTVLKSETPYSIKISNNLKAVFLDSIMLYYRYHYPDFKIPEALEVVQQIFNA